jgi:hypothetical protein
MQRMKKAGGGNPPATALRQPLPYPHPALASRADPLEQAAEVLLLLQFPLADIERAVFACLFERCLGQAYKGAELR